MGYYQEGSTFTAMLPTSTSNIVGQYNITSHVFQSNSHNINSLQIFSTM